MNTASKILHNATNKRQITKSTNKTYYSLFNTAYGALGAKVYDANKLRKYLDGRDLRPVTRNSYVSAVLKVLSEKSPSDARQLKLKNLIKIYKVQCDADDELDQRKFEQQERYRGETRVDMLKRFAAECERIADFVEESRNRKPKPRKMPQVPDVFKTNKKY